jgi:hypothetical protein
MHFLGHYQVGLVDADMIIPLLGLSLHEKLRNSRQKPVHSTWAEALIGTRPNGLAADLSIFFALPT